MYGIEQKLLEVLLRVLLVVNIVLTLMNSALIIKLEWNPPPSYFSNLLLFCHMVASGIKLPGAMIEFNEQIVKVATLNFGSEIQNSNQLNANKQGLRNAGYRFLSVSLNLGFTLWSLFFFTKLFFVFTNMILFFVRTRTRCG